jgi:hypothetical protein
VKRQERRTINLRPSHFTARAAILGSHLRPSQQFAKATYQGLTARIRDCSSSPRMHLPYADNQIIFTHEAHLPSTFTSLVLA